MMETRMIPELPVPWGRHDLSSGETLKFTIGGCRLWARQKLGDLWLAWNYEDSSQKEGDDAGPLFVREQPPEPPDDTSWRRWALRAAVRELRLMPALPDRPIVVCPDHAFHVGVEARTRVYVRVPLWIRVEDEIQGERPLIEIPTVRLSNIWFGGLMDGELCYYISSAARRQMTPDLVHADLAVCPVQINNISGEDLDVQKICLRVINLSLFCEGGHFWADESLVNFKGKDFGSVFDATGRAPDEKKNARLVMPPRISGRKGFVTRMFSSFRELAGMPYY